MLLDPKDNNVPSAEDRGAVRLDTASIDAIATRVADILRSTSPEPSGVLITATEVAAQLGDSRTWVYDNAEKLGAVRLGAGAKARLRFDPRRIAELMRATDGPRQASRRPSTCPSPTWLDKADLIPIRGN